MEAAWKNTIRNGLRHQPISDLHDYLDVHLTIRDLCRRLREDVIRGVYRSREPQLISVEKSLGVVRRVVLPAPTDAILLQAIVDVIERPVLKQAPSATAYYNRTHIPRVENLPIQYGYPWWIVWPQFQKHLHGFADYYPYIVIADVANYFDTIPLQSLRHCLAALGSFSERLLDFLFYLLEAYVWRPHYIRFSGVGLPQLNFDAPRLLGHAYLFSVDRFLQSQSEFARYMDDINVGVGSVGGGKQLLRALDENMLELGIRLNLGKCQILDGESALRYWWVKENGALNLLDNLVKGINSAAAQAHARKRFKTFYKTDQYGYWSKILKRYFTLFTKLKDPVLQRYVQDILVTVPEARPNLFRYYEAVGYSPARFRHLVKFVRSNHCVDDVSLFGSLQVIERWIIPVRSANIEEAKKVAWESGRSGRESGVAGGLRLMAKYGSSNELGDYIGTLMQAWDKSEWLGRQVAAVTPLLDERMQKWLNAVLTRNGLLEGLRVQASLNQLQLPNAFHGKLRAYVRHPSEPYPLEKVIISRALLAGQLPDAEKERLRRHVLSIAKDPMYKRKLTAC